jgi:alkyldihydroxyacetonephosphate synthase
VTRSWWGWGRTDRALPDKECVALAALLPGLPDRPRAVPRLADVSLRPEPFAVALRAAKAALDPAGVLNPGVLIDPV